MKQLVAAIVILISASISVLDAAYAASSTSVHENQLAVHFMDVGPGDCTLLLLPGGKSVLIDAGDSPAGPEITQYIKTLGITRINHLIFTHPHDDHIGGISSIVSEFEINTFYDNGFDNFNSTIFEDYVKLVREDPKKYNVLKAGESLVLDNVLIKVLNPLLPRTGNLNEDSVVLKIMFGNINILLSGDLGDLGERRLMESGTSLTSRILKAGHHGDKHSCSDAFLERVRPETAVISVNEFNKYGRPHKETLDRLEKAGAEIYRTDRNGHIILKTDGTAYSIHTEK